MGAALAFCPLELGLEFELAVVAPVVSDDDDEDDGALALVDKPGGLSPPPAVEHAVTRSDSDARALVANSDRRLFRSNMKSLISL